jgi:hypothetical protein
MGIFGLSLAQMVANIIRAVAWMHYQIQYYFVEQPRRRAPVANLGQPAQATGLWAICAIYQRKKVSPNLLAFLGCLREMGYNVIAVHNGPLGDSLVGELKTVCHTVLVRTPGGRDFGSFKYGTAYLAGLKDSTIKQVVYCNDSVFVRPSRLKTLMEKIRQMPDDFIAMTESFEPRYHVQSWFFAVSGSVFSSAYFQEFWRNYKPLSYRRHLIIGGEIRLTRWLLKHDVYPSVLFSGDSALRKIFAADEKMVISHLIMLSNSQIYGDVTSVLTAQSRKNELMLWMSATPQSPGSASSNFTLPLLERLLADHALANEMNLFNLLMMKFLDFPFMKKDLVFKGGYQFVQIERMVEECMDGEEQYMVEIRGAFRSRDTLRYRNGFYKALAAAGVI